MKVDDVPVYDEYRNRIGSVVDDKQDDQGLVLTIELDEGVDLQDLIPLTGWTVGWPD